MIKLLFLMLLCHIIDDFVLQSLCLSNLKQREWWEKNAPDPMYKYDYITALGIHALSWAIMINLPIILFLSVSNLALGISVFGNGAIHYIVDNLKANKHKINLGVDQGIHIIQVIITWVIFLTITSIK